MTHNRNILTLKLQGIKIGARRLHSTKFYALLIALTVLAGTLLSMPAISSLMSNVAIRSSGSIATILPLHVEGRYIKNALNQTIVLRGVNQAGMLDHPNGWWNPEGGGYTSGYGVWNPDAVKYNLDKMKEWGFNVVRLHTAINWWLDDESNYRQHFKDIITWAGERGIYVIFEPYSVIYPRHPAMPFPPYLTPEEETVIPSKQAFVDYWASVANELKAYPNVIFELFNEPHSETVEGYNARDEWFDAAQMSIDSIRVTGANQIIIVQWDYGAWVNLDYPPPSPPEPSPEGTASTLDWVLLYPLNDPLSNIVYSTHNYRGDFHRSVSDPIRNSYTYDDIKLGLQYAWIDYVLNTLNKPVLVGEIGANMWQTGEELERELAYFNNSLTIYNEWNMSYLAWVWTIPAHMRHGLLQSDQPWCPPPNEVGQILIARIRL